MDSPPPYMPPRKKSNTGLIVGLIIGGVVLCCILPIVGGGGAMFWLFNKSKPLLQCSWAYSDVRDALRKYAAEHDGKLPPADTWQDEIAPYYEEVMQTSRKDTRQMIGTMSSSSAFGCEDGSGGRTGMAINEDLAGMDLSKIENTEQVVLFEVKNAVRNAHAQYKTLTPAGSPKLFGEERGWFLIRMYGPPMLLTKKGEKPINSE